MVMVHCKPLSFVQLQLVKQLGVRNGGNRWLHGRYTINSEAGAGVVQELVRRDCRQESVGL